nr:hypothetical protein [Saccharopolyspora gregorii]
MQHVRSQFQQLPAARASASGIGCWPSSAAVVHATGRPTASASCAHVMPSSTFFARTAAAASCLLVMPTPVPPGRPGLS